MSLFYMPYGELPMNRKNYRTGVLLILISLVFMVGVSACTDGPVGIFASIAQETDINASRTAAFDGTSPDFVGRLGSDYYTIINGTIWKPVAGVWKKLATIPPGVSNGTASSAATIGGATPTLFVTFGLIGDGTQKVWSTINGTDWVSVDATFAENGQIDSLLSANDQLFVVTRADTTVDSATTTSYSVYFWNGTSFVLTGPGGTELTDLSGRPTSVAFDGTDYWLTAGEAIYQEATADALVAVVANLPDDSFTGVTTDGTNVIFSSISGKLYTYNGSGAWPVSGVFEKSDLPHAFSTPTVVDDGTNTYLLIGTNYASDAASASGYLEFDISTEFNPTTASASEGSDFADIVNFQTSVSANYISKFYVADEGAGKLRVFALTVGNGLWSNYFDGTSWSGWARE